MPGSHLVNKSKMAMRMTKWTAAVDSTRQEPYQTKENGTDQVVGILGKQLVAMTIF
jgi:hypothetical protein